MIFKNLEDPVTATSFGLANRQFKGVFDSHCDEAFPHYRFPLDISTVAWLPDKSQISLRAALQSWLSVPLFWDPNHGKLVPLDYMEGMAEEMKDEIRNEKERRHEQRRKEKVTRQEERAEWKKEKAHNLESWRQSQYAEDNYDTDSEVEQSIADDHPADEDSESGLDSDSEVEEPDWEALGMAPLSIGDWIKSSKESSILKLGRQITMSKKRRGRPQTRSTSKTKSPRPARSDATTSIASQISK
jgi:hypothetical protein